MKRKAAKVALGPALDTPEEELDMLSLPTPEDVVDAKEIGNQRMTKRGGEFMATEKTETPEGDDNANA